MISLETVLNRMGEGIERLIGRDEYKLLKTIDGQNLNDQEKLVEIVLNLNEKWELLRRKESRELIINSLERNEVKDLAFVLGISYEGSPYKAVRERKINKNTKLEENLFGFFGFSIPKTEEKIKMPTINKINTRHGLYDHQRDALYSVEKILSEEGRVMLHMPTGSGKTRTAMNLISKHLNNNPKTTVLWLAHSEELCEQAVENLAIAGVI